MKRNFFTRILALLMVAMMSMSAVAQDYDFSGTWRGDLNIPQAGMSISLVFHLEQDGENVTATMDSPDQQAFDIQVLGKVKADQLTMTVQNIGATYTGKLKGNTLEGSFSQMGFSLPLTLTRDDDFINDSLLSVFDNIQLKDVTVTAQRQLIKQELDRVGYDVAHDADSKTQNVLTMLRKVPMVSVDASDEIRVNGQQNFKIYRNGHPDPSLTRNAKDLLKAMPANSVKRIEVITEPGAKYDAEGTGVILNIVMADNSTLSGVSGMATARTDQYGDVGGSLNLTTQLNKVVMSLDYGMQHAGGHVRNHNTGESKYVDSGAEMDTYSRFSMDDIMVHFGNLSASWEPDTLNLVSLSLGGYSYGFDGSNIGKTLMRDAAGTTMYSYGDNSYIDQGSYSVDGRVDYQRRTRLKGETITMSYMLTAWRNKNTNNSAFTDMFNMPVPYSGTNQWGKELFGEHTFQLDWTRPLAKGHTLETGAKYIYRLNRSHNTMEYLESAMADMDTRFRHVTKVGAAYVSYSFQKGSWSARAGLRYEHSMLKASYPNGEQDPFSANLNDWVPSASVRYQIDMANSIKFAYAASINRPGINFLNPAVIEGPYSRSYGNTDLGSVHQHSMSLTFMHVGPKLTFNLSPSFDFSNNGIGAVKWADGLVQVSTYANTVKRYNSGFSAFVQWMPFTGTSVMLNGSLNYRYMKSEELNLKNDRLGASAFANITQFLPWKLQASLFFGMWDGGIDDLYGHTGAMYFHGLSLQRSFLKEDRLTVQLMAQNPFGHKYMEFKSYVDRGDIISKNISDQTSRGVAISVSYRFGSLKTSVKKTSKTIENDDLIGSGKQSGGNGMGGQQQPMGK